MAPTLRKTVLRMLYRQPHKYPVDNDYFMDHGRVSEMQFNGLLIPERRAKTGARFVKRYFIFAALIAFLPMAAADIKTLSFEGSPRLQRHFVDSEEASRLLLGGLPQGESNPSKVLGTISFETDIPAESNRYPDSIVNYELSIGSYQIGPFTNGEIRVTKDGGRDRVVIYMYPTSSIPIDGETVVFIGFLMFFSEIPGLEAGGVLPDIVDLLLTDKYLASALIVEWSEGGRIESNQLEVQPKILAIDAIEVSPVSECSQPNAATIPLAVGIQEDPNDPRVLTQWFLDGESQGYGDNIEITAPLGDSTLLVEVTSQAAAIASDSKVITVEDTTPPDIVAQFTDKKGNEITGNKRKHKKPVYFTHSASDVCDPDVVSAGIMGIQLDSVTKLKFHEKKDKVGIRSYDFTIAVSAEDSSGNQASRDISVPIFGDGEEVENDDTGD